MDRHGMQMMLLSLNAPAVQAIAEPKRATDLARRANDFLAREVAKRPARFQGLAALAMQDPDAATRELQRCIRELGFRGALVNGFSQINDPNSMVYLDDARYQGSGRVREARRAVLSSSAKSPAERLADLRRPSLAARPTWAFGQETAVHALRLMPRAVRPPSAAADHPRHLGEGLPYSIWRVDNRNAWTKAPPRYPARRAGRVLPAEFPPHDLRKLPHADADRRDARDRLGSHHVLDRLAVRERRPRRDLVRRLPISTADRVKIGRTNAERLFKL